MAEISNGWALDRRLQELLDRQDRAGKLSPQERREAELAVDLWDRLVRFWKDAGMRIRPGASPEKIRAFEIKYNLTMPPDVRTYFETVDGMEDEMDDALNRFWPLSMVKLASEELDTHSDRWAYPDSYIFADHCIWSFAFAVKLGAKFRSRSGPVFYVIGGRPAGKQVADSFAAFVEMDLQDPIAIVKGAG